MFWTWDFKVGAASRHPVAMESYIEICNGSLGCPLALSATNIVSALILVGYIMYSGVYEKTWAPFTREAFEKWGEYLSMFLVSFVML